MSIPKSSSVEEGSQWRDPWREVEWGPSSSLGSDDRRFRMTLTLAEAVSRYGTDARGKLANPAVSGEPEDQLRAPLERLLADLTELCGKPRDAFAAVGESAITTL